MDPETTVNQLLKAVRAIEDPVERFKAATATVEAAREELMAGARQIRQEAVKELQAQQMSLADIAKILGVTRSRVHQISDGRTGGKPKPETTKE